MNRDLARSAVLSKSAALAKLTPAQLKWRVKSGRWQRPCPGVFVTHTGPLTKDDLLWSAWRRPVTARPWPA